MLTVEIFFDDKYRIYHIYSGLNLPVWRKLMFIKL
jgi:hypothetical protein